MVGLLSNSSSWVTPQQLLRAERGCEASRCTDSILSGRRGRHLLWKEEQQWLLPTSQWVAASVRPVKAPPGRFDKVILSFFDAADPAAVAGFLEGKDFLLDSVLAARSQLMQRFGCKHNPSLRVQHDPDEGDAWLLLKIRSNLSQEDTRARFDLFEEEWWLDQNEIISAMLVIDVEYV